MRITKLLLGLLIGGLVFLGVGEIKKVWAACCSGSDTCTIPNSQCSIWNINECNRNSDCYSCTETKSCGAASTICKGKSCNNGCWVTKGTKVCPPPNDGCTPGDQTCKGSGILTVCNTAKNWVSGGTCPTGACDGQYCKAPEYCQNECNAPCTDTKKAMIVCYANSIDAFNQDNPLRPGVCTAVAVADCNKTCHPVSETCGGTATCTAPQVSRLDNCGGLSCGAACGTPPPGCTPSNPRTPVTSAPDDHSVTTSTSVKFTWAAPTSWGAECASGGTRGYRICVGSNSTNPCTGGTATNISGGTTLTKTIAGASAPVNYWTIQSLNKANLFSSPSSVQSFCYAGADPANPQFVSAWSSCNAAHKKTRTCLYGCDCTGVVLSEDCTGTIVGALFDASEMSSCPGDIMTNAVYAPLKYKSESFGIAGPWAGISSPFATGTNGNFSETVYASAALPALYALDFADLIASGRASSVKFWCNGSTAAVTTDGQVVTMNVGFWKIFNGWWQATGGNVYAKDGIKSNIPSTLPAANQRLILAGANGRQGVLSYGVIIPNQLGSNVNAKVSDSLREIQSEYKGLRYDYDFYRNRMEVFSATDWDGGTINYDDQGKGYQILKHTGDINLNYSGPTGTQKVILLVDGSVTIDTDMVTPSGAFLAVIAKRNITFGINATKAQGWFVAENINMPCNDVAAPLGQCDADDVYFEGQGSFVGWTGMNLSRSLGGANNTTPSEQFVFRPDFALNAPDPMRVYTRKYSPFVP